ncbi:hypothetical protein P8452_51412 [Trifolium repens]|nr:hypothetical protein P8452_51412 [Trifolium repens]
MISDLFRYASVPSVSVSTCLVVVCSVFVFGSEFSVAVVFQRRRWWGWCYWFTRFSSVFCLLKSWSGLYSVCRDGSGSVIGSDILVVIATVLRWR